MEYLKEFLYKTHQKYTKIKLDRKWKMSSYNECGGGNYHFKFT